LIAMSRRFDVCNGDADGLCAAVQWALHEPGQATLVTGLKRELSLLERVDAGVGDEVNVFDLALPPNRVALLRLLRAGACATSTTMTAAAGCPTAPRSKPTSTQPATSARACW
jgi:hypothetical protein